MPSQDIFSIHKCDLTLAPDLRIVHNTLCFCPPAHHAANWKLQISLGTPWSRAAAKTIPAVQIVLYSSSIYQRIVCDLNSTLTVIFQCCFHVQLVCTVDTI